MKKGDRNKHAQANVGGKDKLPNDDGGHLIEAQFNGPADIDNLILFRMLGKYLKHYNSNPLEKTAELIAQKIGILDYFNNILIRLLTGFD